MLSFRRSETVEVDASPARPERESDNSAPNKRTLADRFELAWIAWGVFYSVLRFAIAWGGFAEHGANPWIFGIIDIGTAFPYAKSTATLTRRIAAPKREKIATPLLIAVTTFFAPYAYLWFAAGAMPDGLRVGMTVFVATLLLAAVVGIAVKSRRLRAELGEEPDLDAAASADAGGVVDLVESPADVVVDLNDSPPEVVVDLTAVEPSVRKAH